MNKQIDKETISRWCERSVITNGISIARLKEICQAELEGRCFIFPCASGKTVYKITKSLCKWRNCDKCDMYCDGYGDCWEGEKNIKITKFEPWMISEINKTVFINCEDAEKNLKKGKNHE